MHRCPELAIGTTSFAARCCGTSISGALTRSVWCRAGSASTSIASGTSCPEIPRGSMKIRGSTLLPYTHGRRRCTMPSSSLGRSARTPPTTRRCSPRAARSRCRCLPSVPSSFSVRTWPIICSSPPATSRAASCPTPGTGSWRRIHRPPSSWLQISSPSRVGPQTILTRGRAQARWTALSLQNLRTCRQHGTLTAFFLPLAMVTLLADFTPAVRAAPGLRFCSSCSFLLPLGLKEMPGAVTARQQVLVRGRSCDDFLHLRLFAQEAQQLRVDFLCMRPSDAMRPALYDVQASARDHFGGAGAGGSERNDVVVVAMDDERWHINPFQVLAEVFVPGCDTRHARAGGGGGRHVPVSRDCLFADTLTQQQVGVVEILEEAGEERVTVGGHSVLDAGKYTGIQTFRIISAFEQVRYHAGDNHRFAHALGAVFSDVACYFASAHRKTD